MSYLHGFSIFDIKNSKISINYYNPDYLVQNSYDIDFSKDGRFLFMGIQEYGLRIFDVSDLNNIKIALQPSDRKETRGFAIDNTRNLIYLATLYEYISIYNYTNLYFSIPDKITYITINNIQNYLYERILYVEAE